MLTIVFGAGASYDSCPSLPPPVETPERPPLANELFDSRFDNELIMFPELTTIVPWLRHRLDGSSVEDVLEDLRVRAGEDPTRAGQLQTIRFYLQLVLTRIESKWFERLRTSSNYSSLLETIRPIRRPSDPVCLVTFNYDRLLDSSLTVVYQALPDLASYVAGDYKLFKLHGSTNWARPVLNPPAAAAGGNDWAIVRALHDQALSLKLGDITMAEGRPLVRAGGDVALPALAVPLRAKVDFECPTSHLVTLRELLPRTTTLVLIGWRAIDAPFMTELDLVPNASRVVCVAGSRDGADEVAARMVERGFHDVVTENQGFSAFVLRRRLESLIA